MVVRPCLACLRSAKPYRNMEGRRPWQTAAREGTASSGRAWGLEPQSRLSCQAIVNKEDLTIEIPRYSINHAKENH